MGSSCLAPTTGHRAWGHSDLLRRSSVWPTVCDRDAVCGRFAAAAANRSHSKMYGFFLSRSCSFVSSPFFADGFRHKERSVVHRRAAFLPFRGITARVSALDRATTQLSPAMVGTTLTQVTRQQQTTRSAPVLSQGAPFIFCCYCPRPSLSVFPSFSPASICRSLYGGKRRS